MGLLNDLQNVPRVVRERQEKAAQFSYALVKYGLPTLLFAIAALAYFSNLHKPYQQVAQLHKVLGDRIEDLGSNITATDDTTSERKLYKRVGQLKQNVNKLRNQLSSSPLDRSSSALPELQIVGSAVEESTISVQAFNSLHWQSESALLMVLLDIADAELDGLQDKAKLLGQDLSRLKTDHEQEGPPRLILRGKRQQEYRDRLNNLSRKVSRQEYILSDLWAKLNAVELKTPILEDAIGYFREQPQPEPYHLHLPTDIRDLPDLIDDRIRFSIKNHERGDFHTANIPEHTHEYSLKGHEHELNVHQHDLPDHKHDLANHEHDPSVLEQMWAAISSLDAHVNNHPVDEVLQINIYGNQQQLPGPAKQLGQLTFEDCKVTPEQDSQFSKLLKKIDSEILNYIENLKPQGTESADVRLMIQIVGSHDPRHARKCPNLENPNNIWLALERADVLRKAVMNYLSRQKRYPKTIVLAPSQFIVRDECPEGDDDCVKVSNNPGQRAARVYMYPVHENLYKGLDGFEEIPHRQ